MKPSGFLRVLDLKKQINRSLQVAKKVLRELGYEFVQWLHLECFCSQGQKDKGTKVIRGQQDSGTKQIRGQRDMRIKDAFVLHLPEVWTVLDSQQFLLPQRRKRVWGLARLIAGQEEGSFSAD